MICSTRPWLIENGLTILECVATPYGEIYPQEVVQVLVGERFDVESRKRSSGSWNRRRCHSLFAHWL